MGNEHEGATCTRDETLPAQFADQVRILDPSGAPSHCTSRITLTLLQHRPNHQEPNERCSHQMTAPLENSATGFTNVGDDDLDFWYIIPCITLFPHAPSSRIRLL